VAKISARGAKEVARFRVTTPGAESAGETLFVLTDDGRVLRKWPGLTGFSVYGRIKDPAKRTAAFLRGYLKTNGYNIK